MSGVTGTSQVQLCKPFAEHVEHLAQIVKDLKERDDHDKIQGRESPKRSLQSGEPNDPVDVELFSKKVRLVVPLKEVRTRETLHILSSTICVVSLEGGLQIHKRKRQ